MRSNGFTAGKIFSPKESMDDRGHLTQDIVAFQSQYRRGQCYCLWIMLAVILMTLKINIKVVFLQPNTTSKLQPLDLGVIQNFKVHYRQHLLRFVLSSIDRCSSASEVASSINALTAIRWISQVWKEVKPLTISKCYKKAGFLTEQLNVTSVGGDTDPFEDLDSQIDLEGHISRTMSTTDKCSAEAYINEDHELPTCAEFNDETWDQTFLECLLARMDIL